MKLVLHNDEYKKLDEARIDHLNELASIDSDDQCANLIQYMDAFFEEEKQCFCIIFQNFKVRKCFLLLNCHRILKLSLNLKS